jgi:hypothetical protein
VLGANEAKEGRANEAKEGRTTTGRALTRAQKLTNALKACGKRAKKLKANCERQARNQYGAPKRAAAKKP